MVIQRFYLPGPAVVGETCGTGIQVWPCQIKTGRKERVGVAFNTNLDQKGVHPGTPD